MKKFRLFRPKVRNPRNLWKFAGKCVRKNLKIRKNASLDQFKIQEYKLKMWEKSFKMLHLRLKRGESLSDAEWSEYDEIVYMVEWECVSHWVAQVTLVIQKENKEEQQKKKGLMGFLWGKKAEEPEKSKDYDALFREIEEMEELPFRQESAATSWLHLTFNLSTSYFTLLNSLSQQLISVTCSHLHTQSQLALDGFELTLSIDDTTWTYTKTSSHSQVFCMPIDTELGKILEIKHISYPEESLVRSLTQVKTKPVNFVVLPDLMEFLTSFFDVSEAEQSVKTLAWDAVQEITDSTNAKISELLHSSARRQVEFDLAAPVITLNLTENQLFRLSLGSFHIENATAGDRDESYEDFSLNISQIKLDFVDLTRIYPILQPLTFNATAFFLKSPLKSIKYTQKTSIFDQYPDIKFNGVLEAVNFNLSLGIYRYLLELIEKSTSISAVSEANSAIEKEKIVKNAVLTGFLWMTNSKVRGWNKVFGVLSGAYVYAYLQEGSVNPVVVFYVKDCSLTNIAMDEPGCEGFKVINRHGECYISFSTHPQRVQWETAIMDLVFSLRTDVISSEITEKRDSWKPVFRLQASMPLVTVKLTDWEVNPWLELRVYGVTGDCVGGKLEMQFNAALNKMEIEDLRLPVEMRSLARSVDDTGTGLIDVKGAIIDPTSPNFQLIETKLDVKFHRMVFNWNQETLTEIFNFLQYHPRLPSSTPCPPTVSSSLTQLYLSISVEVVDFYLNNVQNGISLFHGSVEGATCDFIMQEKKYELVGSLANASLNDTTDYPRTASESYQTGTSFRLFSISEGSSQLLTFKLVILEDGSEEIIDQYSVFVDLAVTSAKFVYLHQPINRLVDFFDQKILGLFTLAGRMKDIQSSFYASEYRKEYGTEENTENPTYPKVRVTVENSVVVLPPRPNYPFAFEIDLGSISVENVVQQSTSRHESEIITIDSYKITGRQVKATCSSSEIAEPVDLTITFTRPVLTPHQLQNTEIDKSFVIEGECQAVLGNFSQFQYMLLLKLCDLNLAYDDHMEWFINPDSPMYKQVENDPRHLGAFIKVRFKCTQISLMVKHEDDPIAEIIAYNNHFGLVRYNDKFIEMDLSAQTVQLYVPEEDERKMSALSSYISETVFNAPLQLVTGNRLPVIIGRPLDELDCKQALTVHLDMPWTGNKFVSVGIYDVGLSMTWAFLEIALSFFGSGVPEYTNETETPNDYRTVYKPKLTEAGIEAEELLYAPKIDFTVAVVNPFVVFPAKEGTRVLVSQGNLKFDYFREHEFESVKNPNINIEAKKKELKWEQLELFSVRKEALTSISALKRAAKRKIVTPFDFTYKSVLESKGRKLLREYVTLSVSRLHIITSLNDIKQGYQSFLHHQTALEVDKNLISALDLIQRIPLEDDDFDSFLKQFGNFSIKNVLNLQRERTKLVTKLRVSGHIRSSSDFQSTEIPNSETNFQVPNMKITLINDSTGAYGPLLSFEMETTTAKQIQSEDGGKLLIEIAGKMDYYNPYNDSWEPLIEPFDAALQHITRETEHPRQQTTITAGALNPISINLSEAMGLHIHKLTTMWTSLGHEPKTEDFSEQISPFSIENDFGNAIVVETQHGDAQVIESGMTVAYERDIETDRVFSVPSDGLNIRLIHDGFEMAALAGISLKKSQCVSRHFDYRGESYTVLLESKLVDTRKVLIVRAPVVIRNEMNVDLHVFFPYKPRSVVCECKAGKICPVPFLYENVTVGLLPLSMGDGQPIRVDLHDLLSQKHQTWLEFRSDRFFFVLQVFHHTGNKRKITLRVLPPLRIKNLLPCPMQVSLVSYQSKLQTPWYRVEKGEDLTIHDFSIKDDIGIGMKVKDAQQTKPVLIATRDPSQRQKSITLIDSEQSQLELLLGYSGRSSREISIYACITLINYTKLPLNFYTKRRGTLRKVPSQNPLEPILCSPCKKIVAELNDQKSNLIRSDAAGAHSYLSVKAVASRDTVALFQFTYTVDIAWPRPEKFFFTRNVTISPRIILVNHYNTSLAIAQTNDTSAVMILQPQERNIFYWPNADLPQFIRIRPLLETKEEARKALRNEETKWEWSGDFAVDRVGTVVCQCWDRSSEFSVIAAEIRLEDYASVVVFHDEDGKFNFYSVENASKSLTLGIYQQNCREHRRFLPSQSSFSIGWSHPRQPHNLNVEIYYGNLHQIPVFLARYQVSMDKLSQYAEQKIKLSDELGIYMYMKVHNVGSSVALEVGEGSVLRGNSEAEEEVSDEQFHLLVPNLGISLIESQPPNVKELIFITLQNVECMIETTASTRTTELKIAGMQVDNQYNALPMCPVLLFQQPESRAELDIFKLLTVTYRDANPIVKSFKEISVQLQTINLRVESILVQRLVGLYLRAVNQMKLWTDVGEVDLFFRQNGPERLTSPHWMTKELTISRRRLYIEDMHLLPIKIIFSFVSLKDENEGDTEDNEVLAILQSRKMIMLSIDSATVKFPSCDLSQVYMSQHRLKKVVSMHYEERLKQEVFRLIWHTDILGTPMNFLSHIGTAVFDLVNEPVQGIVNGPLEGGKGLIKGAGSFLKNSVSATFGSVSKLTGSVATGITALTQGKDGLIERQKAKAKDRPKDALEGVFYGMKSIVMGIGKGVTGVVTDPVKGAKKKGFLGFLSGGAKGIVGIVGKPVAGVFDAVSKTAEGINNTAHSSEIQLGSQRIRPPRVTYGSAHRIRKYRLGDAEMWEDLINISEKYEKLSFCYFDMGVTIEGKEIAIVVFYEKIVVRLVESKGVHWESDLEDIAGLETLHIRLGVGIRRKAGKRGEQRGSFAFTASSQRNQQKFVEKVSLLLREVEQDH